MAGGDTHTAESHAFTPNSPMQRGAPPGVARSVRKRVATTRHGSQRHRFQPLVFMEKLGNLLPRHWDDFSVRHKSGDTVKAIYFPDG